MVIVQNKQNLSQCFSSNNVTKCGRNHLSTTHPCADRKTGSVTGRTEKRHSAQFIANAVDGWGTQWRTVHFVRETRNSHNNHEEIMSSGMWRRVDYQIRTHVSEEPPTSFSEEGGDRIIRNVRNHYQTTRHHIRRNTAPRKPCISNGSNVITDTYFKEVGTTDSPGTSTFVRLHGITSQNTNCHDQ
jgi:hypothetical protein